LFFLNAGHVKMSSGMEMAPNPHQATHEPALV